MPYTPEITVITSAARPDSRFPSTLQERCEAVPHRATVYAQLVESALLWSWAQLQPVEVGGRRLVPPPDVVHCPGAHSVCDLQLSQVSPRSFTPLGPVCTMFRLDREQHRSCRLNFLKRQLPHPVFSLLLLPLQRGFQQTGEQLFSVPFFPVCEPVRRSGSGCPVVVGPRDGSQRERCVLHGSQLDVRRAEDDSGETENAAVHVFRTNPPPDHCRAFQWRDHWMQSVYFLPEESRVAEGEELSLTVCHDDYSLWYSLKTHR